MTMTRGRSATSDLKSMMMRQPSGRQNRDSGSHGLSANADGAIAGRPGGAALSAGTRP
jgi:hypothetical protein